MLMFEKHLVVVSVFIIFISLFSFPIRSNTISDHEISDQYFTNQLIDEIDTPSIEPGSDSELTITLKNPYPDDMNMKNTTFYISIYWLSYLETDKNISEVEEPPVFDIEEIGVIEEIGNLSSGETIDLEYIIRTSEDTEEGVYSIKFRLDFSIDNENQTMKSRGYFSDEDWEEAKSPEEGINVTELDNLTDFDVSGILPDSTFEVRTPVPRWPQYALGIITAVSGVLAVMFYMQEKYGSFPKLEKAFDNWTSKLEEFRSRFK